KGESFTLGAEEHFLLAQLDGTPTADDLCAAFEKRFGEPLTQEELEDFLHLARERGLLEEESRGDRRKLLGGMVSRPLAVAWDEVRPARGRESMAPNARNEPMPLITSAAEKAVPC